MGQKFCRLLSRNHGGSEESSQTVSVAGKENNYTAESNVKSRLQTANTMEGHVMISQDPEALRITDHIETNRLSVSTHVENLGSNVLLMTISEKKNKSTSEINIKKSRTNTKEGHVLISYDWSQMSKALWIKENIKINGYTVWMDVENIGKNVLPNTIEAIENAHVVLVCMSQRYKTSTKYRTEATNAKKMGKIIIPLKMEKDFMSDGWLGFLTLGVKFYDFTGKCPIKDKMRELLTQLAKCYKKIFEEPIIMPFTSSDRQTLFIGMEDINCVQTGDIVSRRQLSTYDKKVPCNDERSSSTPLPNPFDGKKNLSTHPKHIKKITRNDDNALSEEKLEDNFGWLQEKKIVEKELTDTEINSRKDSIFRLLNEAIEKTHRIVSIEKEEEEMREDLWEHFKVILLVRLAFEKFGPLPVEVINSYRREAGQQLSRTKSICILCKVIKTGWQMCFKKQGNIASQLSSRLTWAAFGILWEFSYWSIEIAQDIVEDTDFLKTLQHILTCYRHARIQGEETSKIESHMVGGSLSIIRNLSIVDENITQLRELGFLAIVRPYLDSKALSDRLCAIFSLANLIGEAEREIIHGKDDLLKMIVETLEKTLQDTRHWCVVDSRIFLARDCALTIHRLAKNNVNRTLLVQIGCLYPLIELAKIGTAEEAREALGAIWCLASDKDNQMKMLQDKELNIMDQLIYIREQSRDKSITETTDWTIRHLQPNDDEHSSDDITNVSEFFNHDDQGIDSIRGRNSEHESLNQEEEEVSSIDCVDDGITSS